MDVALAEEQVVKELWLAYKKTKEYERSPAAIPPHHPLVEKHEREGLRAIYLSFIKSLESNSNVVLTFKSRTVGSWLEEWKSMHRTLFHHILRENGNGRKNEVRFGAVGDDELYRIPNRHMVVNEINILAKEIPTLSCTLLSQWIGGYIEEQLNRLA